MVGDKKNRKILAVDDEQINLTLLSRLLEQMEVEVLLAKDAAAGMELAISEKPDLILLDVMMPEVDGFEMCKRLKDNSETSSIPVIFISAKTQTADKIKGLEIGAVDYVTKPFDVGELRARISSVLKTIVLEEKILLLANSDELTGLPNRRRFFDILERELYYAKIKNTSLAVVMIDIDHFKNINDTYGHLEGDAILEQMGKILQENMYPLDVVARYGGEEFIAIMPETSLIKATKAANRICSVVDGFEWEISGKKISVTISIGVAGVDQANSLDANSLVKKADTALYSAKNKGRNCVVCWEEVKYYDDGEKEDAYDGVYNELQDKIVLLIKQLRQYALGTISAFTKAMDMIIDDPYLVQHGQNVKAYSLAIAEEMELSNELKQRIGTAALLEDLGKMVIPKEILKKKESLTEAEWEIIKQHPITAAKILEPVKFFNLEMQFIKHHHEKFDGSGYPSGLKGKEIPIGARILAVADAIDAMTSEREYQSAFSIENALVEIAAASGTHFDFEVVDAFEKAYQKHKSQWPLSKQGCLSEPLEVSIEK